MSWNSDEEMAYGMMWCSWARQQVLVQFNRCDLGFVLSKFNLVVDILA